MKTILTTILASLPMIAWAACPVIPDTDGDGVLDPEDTCTLVANADRRDTNGDGFGNLCDGDLDNDGDVDRADANLFGQAFGTADADADFDGDGVVDRADAALFSFMFGQLPGPAGSVDPVACATTEDLQTTGGVMDFPWGTIAVAWQDMNPGETVSVYSDPTTLDLDAMTPATPAFRVTAPQSLEEFTVDVGPAILAVRNAAGHSLDSEPYPWAFLENMLVKFTGAIRDVVIVPLIGQICTYDESDVIAYVFWTQPCSPDPFWLIDVVDATRATTNWADQEGFSLDPVQKFFFLTGNDAPEKAKTVNDVVYVNRIWFASLNTLQRQGAVIHEVFHAIVYEKILAAHVSHLYVSNWLTESTAVIAEREVYPANTSWKERYIWGPEIVERGLGDAIRGANPADEKYNPFFIAYLLDTDPVFDLFGLYAVYDGDYIGTIIRALGTDYEDVRERFAKAANLCHRNMMPGLHMAGLCGTGDLEEVNLDGPTLLKIGTTYAWSNMLEGDVELEVSGSPAANSDTLITLVSDDGSFSLSVDGALGDTYPLANLPIGGYTVTVSSIEGTDFTALDEYVSVEMVREADPNPPCVGGGPWLFDGGESATAYDSACNDLGYNVNISETATSFICPDTPGIDEVGKFTVRFRFGGDIRELLWPGRVVGSRTNGSIPDEYWPQQFQQPPNPGGCDRLGVRAEAWYDIHSRNTYQTVSWYWNCAEGGNCGSPEARPPSW